MGDPVNHPDHYDDHPACEAIEICEELSFNLGCAVKYLWRAGKKDPEVQDLKKALWYLEKEEARGVAVRDDATAADQSVLLGVPLTAKKLVRVVARHKQTSPLLAQVLESLADDRQGFGAVVDLVERAIGDAEARAERAGQEAMARSAK